MQRGFSVLSLTFREVYGDTDWLNFFTYLCFSALICNSLEILIKNVRLQILLRILRCY